MVITDDDVCRRIAKLIAGPHDRDIIDIICFILIACNHVIITGRSFCTIQNVPRANDGRASGIIRYVAVPQSKYRAAVKSSIITHDFRKMFFISDIITAVIEQLAHTTGEESTFNAFVYITKCIGHPVTGTKNHGVK